MTDPCTPPPGTKDRTWHWLKDPSGMRIKLLWSSNCWDRSGPANNCKPSFLAYLGYCYIGPVEADTPTGVPADWTDCPKCGARRFYPSGQCMQYCDKKPSPPDAKNALLRDESEFNPNKPSIASTVYGEILPVAARALLRDIKVWAVHKIYCAVWDTNAQMAHVPIKCTCGLDSILGRIRASLKGE